MSLSKVGTCLFGGSSLGPPTSGSNVLYIHKNYGFVVVTMVGSLFMCTWKAIKVGQARKHYKIFYPTMYAQDNDHFNCIQRAHQNTLENMPAFLTLLIIGGLEMPVFSAIAGNIWVIGRIMYARGYYTGDPKKRMQGAWGTIGLVALLVPTVKFAVKLIMNR